MEINDINSVTLVLNDINMICEIQYYIKQSVHLVSNAKYYFTMQDKRTRTLEREIEV